MPYKICYKCKNRVNIKLFRKNTSKKGGRASECKKCHLSYTKQRRNINRQFVFDILKNCGGCIDCGESNVATLQFDHVKGKKIANISLLAKRYSIKKIKEEMLKCEIVCANCHAIRTAKTQNWYANIK